MGDPGGVRVLDRTCRLCRGPVAGDDCYARFEKGERPVCRGCWEQLLVDPGRILRQIERVPLDQTPPAFPPVRA